MTGFRHPFVAAITDDLEKMMREELLDSEHAVTDGVHEAGEDILFALRQNVIQGGLGARLSKSWRIKHYPKGGKSLGAASYIWTKAPKLIQAFDTGAVIRSKDGWWLAIPTDSAPKGRYRRKKISPSNWPSHIYGPLRFVWRDNGPSLLVADDQRQRKGKRKGYALSGSKRALKTKHGLSTVPMFTLHLQVKLKRRLNAQPILDKTPRRMMQRISEAYQVRDRMRGRK